MFKKQYSSVKNIRDKLRLGKFSIGSWMQMPNFLVAEIVGAQGYDWVAVDLEHGSISHESLPSIFGAIELGGALPMARLAAADGIEAKRALEAGALGIIFPMVESSVQLKALVDASRWPPAGKRGVGFCRANLFGGRFDGYKVFAQEPLIIAMIESAEAVSDISNICKVNGLDAIFIGPYDLSASLGVLGQFDNPVFLSAIDTVRAECAANKIPSGIHVVQPSVEELRTRIEEGYQFLAYSMDSVFLQSAARFPL